jgi:hypothetical protein
MIGTKEIDKKGVQRKNAINKKIEISDQRDVKCIEN